MGSCYKAGTSTHLPEQVPGQPGDAVVEGGEDLGHVLFMAVGGAAPYVRRGVLRLPGQHGAAVPLPLQTAPRRRHCLPRHHEAYLQPTAPHTNMSAGMCWTHKTGTGV